MAVAKALHSWLPTVVNAIEPWISTEGLRAGLKWNQQLERELDDTSFGIIVVTPWNQGSQWLNFEAGALSKRVKGADSRVAPLLIDFKKSTDLVGPMASYQATLPERGSMESLLISINEALGDEKRSHELLKSSFDICWPSFKAQLEKIDEQFADESDPTKAPHPTPVVGDTGDAMAEILASVRELTRTNALLRNDFAKRTRSVRQASGADTFNSHVKTRRELNPSKRDYMIVQEVLNEFLLTNQFSLRIFDDTIWIRVEDSLSPKIVEKISNQLRILLPSIKVIFTTDSIGQRSFGDDE